VQSVALRFHNYQASAKNIATETNLGSRLTAIRRTNGIKAPTYDLEHWNQKKFLSILPPA
jgi:hypothetical protein